MALTLAEKQERYRERHLGLHGTKERIVVRSCVITVSRISFMRSATSVRN
jgi:hypothetical protein